MDLMHGQPYVGNISVRAGGYPDLEKAQVVVIAAGSAQRPGEKRTDLLNRNVDIFRTIVSQLDRYAPKAVIIVASNPVDILSYAIQELSSRPPQQIIGTGTMLDTARFRSSLGSYYGVDCTDDERNQSHLLGHQAGRPSVEDRQRTPICGIGDIFHHFFHRALADYRRRRRRSGLRG